MKKATKHDFFRDFNYKPLPKQLEFHNLTNKYKLYCGGIGSGKSHAGCMEALYTMLSYPKALELF